MVYDTRLKFFEMVSNKLNGFLKGFLTDKPMIPFMADVPDDIVRDFLIGVILKDVFRKANTIYKLINLDPQDNIIRKKPENIDVEFAAKLKLEQAGLKPNESKVYKFKQQAGEFLAKLLAEAVVRRWSVKKLFLKISQNSQENNCARVSYPEEP